MNSFFLARPQALLYSETGTTLTCTSGYCDQLLSLTHCIIAQSKQVETGKGIKRRFRVKIPMPAAGFEPSTFRPKSSGFGEFPPYGPVPTFCFDHGWAPLGSHWPLGDRLFGAVAGIQVLTWTRTTQSVYIQGSRPPTTCVTAPRYRDRRNPKMFPLREKI